MERFIFDGPRQFAIKGIGNIWNEETKAKRLMLFERAGQNAWTITQLSHGAFHAHTGIFANAASIIDNFGNGGGRNTCKPRHIIDRRLRHDSSLSNRLPAAQLMSSSHFALLL